MDKIEFTQLAESAAREGMQDFDWAVCRYVISTQLKCLKYETPALEDFAPTAFYFVDETGGSEGGNCWGGEARHYTKAPSEADKFEALDLFLEEYFPAIPFLAYRKLMRQMHKEEFRDSDPYSNSTNYDVRSLSFDVLWEVLEAANLTG